MGKNPFQYALTRDQSIALVLVEPLGCTELVKYIIRVIKDEQMKDTRREHMRMFATDTLENHVASTDPQVLVDIQCLRPGFMKVIVPSEENAYWRNHRDTYSDRHARFEKLIPGMMDMRLQDKLEMLENYLAPAWGAADADALRDSLYCFNMGMSGSTDKDDYGGVYYETCTPELGLLHVRTAVPEQPIDFTIL